MTGTAPENGPVPTRALPRALLALLALAGLLLLLLATARLRVGETVLLPGEETGGVRVVSGAAGELSFALDVRNSGLVPIRVEGPAGDRVGPYATRLGRGPAGGGVPEQERFSPFVLWPGQQRLLVLHLTRDADPSALTIDELAVATSVVGVGRTLGVALPTPLQVSAD